MSQHNQTNPVNLKKLLHSKWTAVQPQGREKHFMVSRLLQDENGDLMACVLEAVLTMQEYQMHPDELKDASRWQMGWK